MTTNDKKIEIGAQDTMTNRQNSTTYIFELLKIKIISISIEREPIFHFK